MEQQVRIYIIGAQCTGKTTLINALETHFSEPVNRDWDGNSSNPPNVIKEVARSVLREHSFIASDITNSRTRCLQLQELILKAQHSAELETNWSWYLSDRSGLDPVVYATIYVGPDEAMALMESQEFQELKERMRNSLVILCEAGVLWLTDDGVRLMPKDNEDWMRVHQTFCELLVLNDIRYNVISKDMTNLDDRVQLVTKLWKNFNVDTRKLSGYIEME
ncbi:hypothetical protein M501DRAFT_966717 [Patellaria atrata CBS 101060]|uniref:NadR/Ttd14 AAA domain-containing protein n=1 Tax=Patellaria atrata CBS 101060 TaxID=1346257 RepID=A0A9P4VRW0_9PEZI|nr:hypothetical protein M501DRAFT_966717 [Patellaria atrata CBS 101060]